jgi:formyltetrahydrofolate hydrolase
LLVSCPDREGWSLEEVVRGRAVRLHLKRRILTCANKTVIFD